jgi:type IV secretory pathway VirB2 component (pilin)
MLPSAFYPLHLLFLLVPFNRDGLFSPHLYNETFILTHLLCAFFTFALIRELGLSRFSAYIGACCFSFGGMLVRMIWLPFVEAGIWLPAVLFFLSRALRASGTRAAALQASFSGLCLGLSILTGGLHFSIMQGVVVVTAIGYWGMTGRSQWCRLALILSVVLVAAGGTGAVQLLPSYEYAKYSLRYIDGGAFPASEKIPYYRLHPGMWPQGLATVLFPTAFDFKIGGGETWPLYIGVLPFFFAVTAVWKSWGNIWVRYLAGLSVLSFAYSLSEFSPLHGVLYAIVPFLWTVRSASRFVYLATFALSILAAVGLEHLLDHAGQDAPWQTIRRLLKWIAITCVVAFFVPAVFGRLGLEIWTGLSLLLILASCAMFGYLSTHKAGTGMRVLVAAFILFDLSAFNWGQADIHDPSKPNELLEQMISLRGAARFLKTRSNLGRVQVAVSPEPNIGDAYGVQALWGGGGTVLADYSRLVTYHEELLNSRYVVRPVAATEPAPLYQDGHWKVYENPRGYPRAWIVHQAVVEPSKDAVFHRLDDTSIDLHKTAVLDRPLPQALAPQTHADEAVVFRSYEDNRIVLDAEAGSAALLILAKSTIPAGGQP